MHKDYLCILTARSGFSRLNNWNVADRAVKPELKQKSGISQFTWYIQFVSTCIE